MNTTDSVIFKILRKIRTRKLGEIFENKYPKGWKTVLPYPCFSMIWFGNVQRMDKKRGMTKRLAWVRRLEGKAKRNARWSLEDSIWWREFLLVGKTFNGWIKKSKDSCVLCVYITMLMDPLDGIFKRCFEQLCLKIFRTVMKRKNYER